ncbi:hypothetical protein [Nocardioides ferulae]|uniref:hypothetical protein n=1 Tax=Nocardioides ferulae TaxID=2340821 RepID=UPI00197FA6A2|nr:hypothetical protein [Nocardioides ferulae]
MTAVTSGEHAPGVPLVPADAVRLAALVSVVAGGLGWGFVGFALFMLVLGGSMIPRALGASAALDAAYSVSIVFAAWAAQLDWYAAVPWLDVVVHVAATGLVAAVVHFALVRVGALPAVDEPRLPRARLGGGLVTVALGLALAVLWELGEWGGHTYLDDRIQVGYADTMGDLAAGLLGAVVAGLILARGALLAGERR